MLIAEGKVIEKKSFWNNEHTMIYTANTIEVYKLFKGNLVEKSIEVITEGGGVGNQYIETSDLLNLDQGQTGIFFCYQRASKPCHHSHEKHYLTFTPVTRVPALRPGE